jgi:DnaJ family protein B protein 12
MSTANKDEAIKCVGLAQKYFDNSNFSLARKYANKSIDLFRTPEASKLLNLINQREAAGASGETRSNGASMHTEESTAGTRHRHTSHANGLSGSSTKDKGKEKAREYTPEQAAVVAQIRKCKVTEYYEILGLKKECDENDVKKAYRKVSLPTLP